MVGDHRKPTVIVEDWRLPHGWVKHMYQRSNVLGKWDVILVTPSGKRFRSKSDLKVYLEEQNLVYNPDVYDFSIHRRRAKDLNCYVYTPDYVPQYPVKPKSFFDNLSPEISKSTQVSSPPSAAPTSCAPELHSTPSNTSKTPVKSTLVEDKTITQINSEIPNQLLNLTEDNNRGAEKTTGGGHQEPMEVNVVERIREENGFGKFFFGLFSDRIGSYFVHNSINTKTNFLI